MVAFELGKICLCHIGYNVHWLLIEHDFRCNDVIEVGSRRYELDNLLLHVQSSLIAHKERGRYFLGCPHNSQGWKSWRP